MTGQGATAAARAAPSPGPRRLAHFSKDCGGGRFRGCDVDISWNQKLEKCGEKEEKEVGLGPGAPRCSPGAEPEVWHRHRPRPRRPAGCARVASQRSSASGRTGARREWRTRPHAPGGRAAAPGADHGLSPGVSFASLHLLRHSLISSKLSKLLA